MSLSYPEHLAHEGVASLDAHYSIRWYAWSPFLSYDLCFISYDLRIWIMITPVDKKVYNIETTLLLTYDDLKTEISTFDLWWLDQK